MKACALMNTYLSVLKQYAVFSGRAGREEYWIFFLFNVVIGAALTVIDHLIGTGDALSALYAIGVIIPSLAVGVRRLHDTNRSAWWILIGLVPLIGPVVLLIFSIQESQPGDNRYGPNPAESALH